MATPTPRRDLRLPIAVTVAALLLVALVVRSADPFGWWSPAASEDRADPGDVVVLELRRTAELTVATGTYQVPVTVELARTGLRAKLPELLDSERVVALYQGDVSAVIDLRELSEDSVRADPQSRSVTVRVPEPTLTRPNLDPAASRVLTHERGAWQRFEDVFDSTPSAQLEQLDQTAADTIAQAAAESDLPQTARDNGVEVLTQLCRALGYTDITIEYVQAPN